MSSINELSKAMLNRFITKTLETNIQNYIEGRTKQALIDKHKAYVDKTHDQLEKKSKIELKKIFDESEINETWKYLQYNSKEDAKKAREEHFVKHPGNPCRHLVGDKLCYKGAFGGTLPAKLKTPKPDQVAESLLNSMKKILEEFPTNAMGASSSTQGPIQTFDPLLMKKALKRKKLKKEQI